MKSFFENLFGKKQQPRSVEKRAERVRLNEPPRESGQLYKKGDVIGGLYEVHGTLGMGGFGIIYLVYKRDTGDVLALKTFREQLLNDPVAREAFTKEAQLWIHLEEHPFVLSARFVEKVSNRLFVAMDYLAPDAQNRVNLGDHLAQATGPLDTNQLLKWGIQFCLGMEHVNSRGIKCHRDIKPANILITQSGTLKITDFGLASAAVVAYGRLSSRRGSLLTGGADGAFGFSVVEADGKVRCGTPGYIPPEVYRCEAADARSDIYSFGLVLWQMAAGSRVPPFLIARANMEECLRKTYDQQMASHVQHVNGALGPVIERCLKPRPTDRYGTFEELREVLESVWKRSAGTNFEVPKVGQKTAGFWINKGVALENLGRSVQAIECYDKALAIDPRSGIALTNMGVSLDLLGRPTDAVKYFDKALAIDPRNAGAWTNLGNCFRLLGKPDQALRCWDKALEIDPQEAKTWNCKGTMLATLGRHEEALAYLDKALTVDPGFVSAWGSKGIALAALGRPAEAIACFDKELAIDPLNASPWATKGIVFAGLGRNEEALGCFDKALELDPRHAQTWSSKAASLRVLKRYEQAITCYDNALAVEPNRTDDWVNKGVVLAAGHRNEEAMLCFGRALAIDPRHAHTWFSRALLEEQMGHGHQAVTSYRKSIEFAAPQHSQIVTQAKQRLGDLESKGI